MKEIMTNGIESLEQKNQTALPHPWRRFFARGIDVSIYSVIWACIQYFVFRWHPENNFLITLLISYINYTLMIIIEPLLLSTWGTTPGKAIFGLILRSGRGDKLTYTEALIRTFGVFGSGYGYGIPFYNLVRMYKCYKASLNGEMMNWDYDCDTSYDIKDLKAVRILAYIAVGGFIFAVSYIISLQSHMPLHRGSITPIQYAENINDILKRPNTHKEVYMDENGCWQEKDNIHRNNVINIEAVFSQINHLPNHKLTVEDGIVTGVEFTLENDEKSGGKFIMLNNITTQKYYMTLAFLCAQKSTNCFTLTDPEIESILNRTDDFDIEFHGVHIVQKIEHSGYIVTDTAFWAKDGEEQKFKMRFSMELMQ